MNEAESATLALMFIFGGVIIFWGFVAWIGLRIIRVALKALTAAENKYR